MTPTQTLVGHNAGEPSAEASRVSQAVKVQIRCEECLLSDIQGIFAVAQMVIGKSIGLLLKSLDQLPERALVPRLPTATRSAVDEVTTSLKGGSVLALYWRGGAGLQSVSVPPRPSRDTMPRGGVWEEASLGEDDRGHCAGIRRRCCRSSRRGRPGSGPADPPVRRRPRRTAPAAARGPQGINDQTVRGHPLSSWR